MKPRRPKRLYASVCAVVALVAGTGAAGAQTPEAKGLEIALEADRRDRGYQDWSADLQMILKNRQGQTSRRELRMRGLENPDMEDGDKTLIVFDQPRDVKGTALLTHTHILEADDQWLYLPALKRIKRITSNNKSGPFMGSEFAYEDFASQEVAKYTYKYLRDEPCEAHSCFVVERYPTYDNSGYTRQIVWIDTDEYRTQKAEFYDRKDQLLKTLVFLEYRRYLDKHWRAHDLFMENHQTGKSTRLLWSDHKFRTGLTEQDFTKTSLKRAR
jgi:outer membrane lipoprotein-sorting protein